MGIQAGCMRSRAPRCVRLQAREEAARKGEAARERPPQPLPASGSSGGGAAMRARAAAEERQWVEFAQRDRPPGAPGIRERDVPWPASTANVAWLAAKRSCGIRRLGGPPARSGPPDWAREERPRRLDAKKRLWRRAGACPPPPMSPPLIAQARAGRGLARARCALLQRGRATAGLPHSIAPLAPGPVPAGLRQRAVRRRARGHTAASDAGLAGSQLARAGSALVTHGGRRTHKKAKRGKVVNSPPEPDGRKTSRP